MEGKFKDLKYLLELLDDDNDEVYSIVHDRILSYGEDVLPELKNVWRNTESVVLFERVDSIIKEIARITNSRKFEEWLKEGKETDILNGVLLLNKMYNPDIDVDGIKSKIDKLIKDIWLELNNNLTSLEKINIVNHFIFKEFGFNVGDTPNDRNHFFDSALELKLLNEVTSSIFYFYVCRSLDIDVDPVMFKNRIFLGYVGNGYTDFSENEIMFLISPEEKGKVFRSDQIDFMRGKPKDLIKYWMTTAILIVNDRYPVLAKEYRNLLRLLIKTQV